MIFSLDTIGLKIPMHKFAIIGLNTGLKAFLGLFFLEVHTKVIFQSHFYNVL